MELHQIRYFLAVCDHGSFTRAARFSYISQPSLTQSVKKLESELGGELFTRDRSGCVLTPLGRMVEPNLRKIYKEAVATKAEALRFCRLNTVPLRVGLMETIGAQRLNPIFASFRQAYPLVEFELIVDSEAVLLNRLEADLLDVVISSPAQPLTAPLQSTLLYTERYVVAFSRSHRFNQLSGIDLKAMQTEPYLDRLNCELREKLRAICQDQDIGLYASYRSNSEDWIMHLVRADLGVALMPEYSLPLNAEDVKSRYLSNPEISRRIYAISLPPNRKQKPEVNNFLASLDTL